MCYFHFQHLGYVELLVHVHNYALCELARFSMQVMLAGGNKARIQIYNIYIFHNSHLAKTINSVIVLKMTK